jgi:AcrR family transcriptional regulator
LTAAKAEFAAHGLRAASVRAIGAKAGVTAAMINYYFGSKRALYDQIVATAQARLYARVVDALTRSDEAELPARLTSAYFDFLSEEREFQRLMIREVLDRPEGLREFVRRYIVPLRALFEDLFGRGDEAFQAAVSLFGAVAGYFLYEPVLTELLGEDAMAEKHLERRRRHLMALAVHLSEWAQ